jgi:MoaA/NifB/PqqE/SkfB family radical SAM enzyme
MDEQTHIEEYKEQQIHISNKYKSKKVVGVRDIMDPRELLDFDRSWISEALCNNQKNLAEAGIKPENFFEVSITKKNIKQILAINKLCSECPVSAQCLHEALHFGYDGYFAGTNEKLRKFWIRSYRDNSVIDLSIEECETMLQQIQENSLLQTKLSKVSKNIFK